MAGDAWGERSRFGERSCLTQDRPRTEGPVDKFVRVTLLPHETAEGMG